jgi:hypothetical protein
MQDKVAFGYASIFIIASSYYHICHQYDIACDRVFTYLVPMMDILTMFTLCCIFFNCYNNHDDAHQDVQIEVKPPSS